MTAFLSKEVQDGLDAARRQSLRKASRLRLKLGETDLPILKYEDNGLWLDRSEAAHVRGLVDIYEGSRHLYQALIVASQEEGDMTRYEFKRNTPAETAPPVDFERPDNAPIALIDYDPSV